MGLWILEDRDGEFVGDCGLTSQTVDGTEELEVGNHVLPQRQGQGLASEAAAACLAFARRLGKRRVIAIIRPDNQPSRRVAEEIGLTLDRETAKFDLPVVVYAVDLPTG